MSADNLVSVFPFRKKNNQVVWIVAELTLSGLEWEKVQLVADPQHQKRTRCQVFDGKNAQQQAAAAGRRLLSELFICEYGLSVAESTESPPKFQDLVQQARDAGYRDRDLARWRESI